jgi:hypothetical protein
LSYSFLAQKSSALNQLKLKSKNIDTLQEMEFVINPEEDFASLPEEMQQHVSHFFNAMENFKLELAKRIKRAQEIRMDEKEPSDLYFI